MIKSINLQAIILITLCGCGGSDTSNQEAKTTQDDGAAIEQYYKDNPNFFIFATPTDIPTNLTWENGMDLPEIGSPKSKKGGTFNGSLQDFPRTLRTVGPDSNGGFRSYLLDPDMPYAATHPNNKNNYFPGLAKAWAVDRANNTVYIRLNPDARWSDGTPVTSDDAVYMFYFLQSEHIQAPFYYDFYRAKYNNITRYDKHTFSISMKVAKPDMASYALGLRPRPRHFYGTLNDNYVKAFQWKVAPTTGPFVIHDKDIKKGRSITLTRNKDWWAKDNKYWKYRYNEDKIHLTVIRDINKSIEAFKKGNLDTTGLNQATNWYEKVPNDLPAVKNGYIKKTIFYNQIAHGPIGLWINTSKPLLSNRAIREGIQHANNWPLVLQKFFRGDYERLDKFADGYGPYSNPNIKARDYSPEKALKLFKQAGFAERGPDGILVNDQGQKLAFTLTTGYPVFKDLVAILKEEARKSGLEFNLEVLDSTTGWKKVQEKNHEIALTGFASSGADYPQYWQCFHSDNANKPQTNNLTNFANDEADKLIDAYRESSDEQEMITLAHQIEQIIHDEAVFVPGYKQPYYRCGYWRWLCFPDDFNLKHSDYHTQYYIHWIDEDIKKETLAAKKDRKQFPPQILIFDQYKTN